MTVETAAPTREVLLDRYWSVMDWTRTGGNASDEYREIVTALGHLVDRIAGWEVDLSDQNEHGGTVDELVDLRLGPAIVDVIMSRGIAR